MEDQETPRDFKHTREAFVLAAVSGFCGGVLMWLLKTPGTWLFIGG